MPKFQTDLFPFQTDAVGLVSEINEKHLVPWAAICSAGGLDNTPLTPYIDQNSVHPNHLHLDGSKLRKEGFTFSVPKPSHDNLMEVSFHFQECHCEEIDENVNKEL